MKVTIARGGLRCYENEHTFNENELLPTEGLIELMYHIYENEMKGND